MGDPKDAASPEAAPLDKPAESGILGALYSSAPIQPEPLHKNEDIEGIGQLHSIQSELMAADPTGFTDEDGIRRTGNTVTTTSHIITAVIGAGVLALPYSMASLGWILGPICFVLFAVITLYTAQLLADLYFIDGKRMRTYTDMVSYCFGLPGMIAIGIVQQFNLVLTALAYTITATISIQALANSYCATHCIPYGQPDDCLNADGTPSNPDGTINNCFNKFWEWAIIFGALQIVLNQIPTLEKFWWMSIIGAIMSFGYSFIAFGMTVAYAGTNGGIQPMKIYRDNGTVDQAQTAWNVVNAIGAILFAYSFSFILLEIQDTIATRRGTKWNPVSTMKISVNVAVGIMTAFYIAIASAGFASKGYNMTGSVLDAYVGRAPAGVIDAANAMVLIHLIPAYQVWSQPHYEFVDLIAERSEKWPRWLGKGWVLRLWYRTLYTCFITFLAILLPFFNTIMGFVGAMGFWPATVFFPIHCWIKVFKPSRRMKIFLWCLDIFCLLVTILAIAGSIQLIVDQASTFKPFSS